MTTNTTPEAEGEQLKPCPYCGGSDARPTKDSYAYVLPNAWIVLCACGTCGPNVATRALAITAWNTRATPPPAPTEPGTPLVDSLAFETMTRDYGNIEVAPADEMRLIESDLHAANRELAEARAEEERLRRERDEATDMLKGAVKWLDRLTDRREMLPEHFFAEYDPAPLAVKIRHFLTK